MDLKELFKTWLLLALGVTIAAHTAVGISYDSNAALIIAILLLSICNVVFKPLLMLFSLPFIILSFGLGIWIINALLFMFVGWLVEGFHVASFWNALWGAFVVSLTGGVANLLFGKSRVKVQVNRGPQQGQGQGPRSPRQARKPLDDDDVIDI